MDGITAYGKLLVGAQIALVLVGLCLLAFWPASTGKMIVVPLTRAASASLLPSVLNGRTQIIAKGPFSGSFVLWGKRSVIRAALHGQNTLVLAAPQSGCSSRRVNT